MPKPSELEQLAARVEAAEGSVFTGYAAIFGEPDKIGDVIRPGAFAWTLSKKREIPWLLEHQPTRVIGRVVDAREDSRGLAVALELSKPIGELPCGLSFAYRAKEWDRTAQGRLLRRIELIEISSVNKPLHPAALRARSA